MLICLVLVLGTAALYFQATGFKFADSDDRDYVVENYRINSGWSLSGMAWSFQAGYAANWHPLTWMSHMLDCQLYGLNPGGHHATNIVLHILNAVLVFLILQRMTGAPWRSGMVAALFAWHPMHVESIAWIAERKDVLSTFLWLLTLGAYGLYVENRQAQRPDFKFYYLAALLLYALALMSKPMVVTLPCLMLLLDWWPLRRWPGSGGKETAQSALAWLRLAMEKIPFFLLSACCCALTVIAQRRGGAIQTMGTVPLHFRMYNTVMSYWRYIGKLLVPRNMAALYPIGWDHRSILLYAVAIFALLAVSTAAINLRYKRPYWFVGWLWYLGALVPVIGLIQVGGQNMADRYTYVPSLGLFILLIWTVSDWAKSQRHGRLVLAVAATVILGACAFLTARQLRYWKNGETLWSHAIAVTKDNYVAHEAYAEYLVENHRWDEARSECRRALDSWQGFGAAHLWLGIILYGEGKFDEAKREITPSLKDRWDVERGEQYLGKIALEQNLPAEAEAAFQKELEFNPALPSGHCGLGQALARQGKLEAARKEFEEALHLLPDYPEALNSLAWLLASHPRAGIQDGNDAVKLATLACQLTLYQQPPELETLAAAYAAAGRFDEANATAQKAHDLALAQGHNKLASQCLEMQELFRSHRPYREPTP
jgi:tetratricopeptide (TPR) repeat protein